MYPPQGIAYRMARLAGIQARQVILMADGTGITTTIGIFEPARAAGKLESVNEDNGAVLKKFRRDPGIRIVQITVPVAEPSGGGIFPTGVTIDLAVRTGRNRALCRRTRRIKSERG